MEEGNRLDLIEEAKAASTQEGSEPEQVSEGQSEEQPPSQEKETRPYEDEELAGLSIGEIDETRLQPHQKLVFNLAKNMERGYQQKYQSLAEERRQAQLAVQQAQQQQNQQQLPTEEQIFISYLQNPHGTNDQIDRVIRALRAENPVDERIDALASLQRKMADRRMDLIIQMNAQQQNQAKQGAAEMMYAQGLKQMIPEFFNEKGEFNQQLNNDLVNFARGMGYNDAQIMAVINSPDIDFRLRNISVIHSMYKQALAAQGIQPKGRKKSPSSVEAAGSGFDASPEKAAKWGLQDQINHFAKSRAGSLSGG